MEPRLARPTAAQGRPLRFGEFWNIGRHVCQGDGGEAASGKRAGEVFCCNFYNHAIRTTFSAGIGLPRPARFGPNFDLARGQKKRRCAVSLFYPFLAPRVEPCQVGAYIEAKFGLAWGPKNRCSTPSFLGVFIGPRAK